MIQHRVETCLKLFQNYFRWLLQLVNIFQHVWCRWNDFEIILELSGWNNFISSQTWLHVKSTEIISKLFQNYFISHVTTFYTNWLHTDTSEYIISRSFAAADYVLVRVCASVQSIFTGTWLRYVRVFAVVCPSVVCLSSVTSMHPTHGVEIFGNISSALCSWPS